MNKGVTAVIVSIFTAAAGGCTSMAKTESTPAVATRISLKAKTELTNVVSKALDGRSVLLASDTFLTDNRLIIERAQMMQDGNPINGRSYEKPDHFYLMLDGNDCILHHEETGEKYQLYKMKCAAMTTPGRWPQQ